MATLTWDPGVDPGDLQRALTNAAENAFSEQGLRRLQVAVAGADRLARRAALRAGFRQEGVQRSAVLGEDGVADDRYLFARLVTDQVGGSQGFSGVMNSTLPRKRLIAHVLLRDDQGRVLLCETQFKADWELPGGIVEPGESPRAGAVREVREELGVERPVGRLLAVDWLPPYLGWDDACEFIFDGGQVAAAELEHFSLQPTEIRTLRLCTLAEAEPLLTPIAHRRLAAACSVPEGQTVYLEDGWEADTPAQSLRTGRSSAPGGP